MGLFDKAKAAVKTREADVLKACLSYLRLRGHLAIRINGGVAITVSSNRLRCTDTPGCADILGLSRDGRFYAVECKSSSGRQSAEQKEFEKDCVSRGGLYVLARSVDDLKEAGL